jgi:hypothetical protein
MSPCKIVVSVLRRGISLLTLTAFLGMSSLAAPISLPNWAQQIESSVPKLSPEVISEVDEIITFLAQNAETFRYDSKIAAQRESYRRRFVELQDQADQAMIWQYFKATSGRYRGPGPLSSLQQNPELATWLLPIVRHRIDWLKQAIHDPEQRKYSQIVFENFEIHDLYSYLIRQGELSDIENLNLLVDESIKLKFKSEFGLEPKISDHERLQGQLKLMQERRNRSEQQAEPNWQKEARRLIAEGVLNEDALKPRTQAQSPSSESNSPKPLGPKNPLPETKTILSFLPPWMMWLFIFAASSALLRWVLRKAKRAPGD